MQHDAVAELVPSTAVRHREVDRWWGGRCRAEEQRSGAVTGQSVAPDRQQRSLDALSRSRRRPRELRDERVDRDEDAGVVKAVPRAVAHPLIAQSGQVGEPVTVEAGLEEL